jgi:hypothetical protein
VTISDNSALREVASISSPATARTTIVKATAGPNRNTPLVSLGGNAGYQAGDSRRGGRGRQDRAGQRRRHLAPGRLGPGTLTVRRLAPDKPVDVPHTLTDGCGAWPTLVGGRPRGILTWGKREAALYPSIS